MSDVFISYSREDQAIATQYAQALEREGLGVWWDAVLNPGETFDKVTETALREARAVIVLWSKQSVDSRWVRSEATQADRYGTLVPVMIETCDRPIMFELAHTVDLSGWNGDAADARWRAFIDSLKRFVTRSGPSPAIATAAPSRASSTTHSPVTLPKAHRPGKWIGWAAAAAAVAAIAFVALRWRDRPAEPTQVMRFTVSFQDDVSYTVGEDFVRSASISPDGKRIVFTGSDRATGVARLFIRMIDSANATPLLGTEEGTEPFWSPDSRSVGFNANGKLKIASIAGGPVRELADAPSPGGGTWNDRNQILIRLQSPGPLVMIPAAGGAPTPVTALEPGDIDHDWPQFLDDGERFLYVSRGRTNATNKVYLASVGSKDRTLLLEGVTVFAFAAPDHVIYLRNSALMVQALDAKGGRLTGTPVALADNALAPFSASRTGALTYRTVPTRPNPLVWVRPDGSEIGEAVPPGYITDPQISPDGTRIAMATRDAPDGMYDVSIMDVATKSMRKLTVHPAHDRAPVWSPDGKSIVYLSVRPDAPGLYLRNANGVGEERLVLPSKGVVWPYQWTRFGLSIFDGASGSNDIAILSGEDLGKRIDMVVSPFNDVDGAVSPDGKWFVYTSNFTGRWELYLTTTEPSATRLPVTTEGACDPTWSPDGTTIYYTRPSTAELMAITVTRGDPPVFGKPRRLHPGPLEYPSAHSLDIAPDGSRLVLSPSFAVQGDLTVIVNWQAATVQ